MQASGQNRVRVLVVDHSPDFGQVTASLLSGTQGVDVVGLATDSPSAIALFQQCQPEVLVFGISHESDRSLEALRNIQSLASVRALAVAPSSTTGAALAVEAVRCGALEVVLRPGDPASCDNRLRDALRFQLRVALNYRPSTKCGVRDLEDVSPTVSSGPPSTSPSNTSANSQADERIIVVGAGVGGMRALMQVAPHLRRPLPPIVISLPLPEQYLVSLAQYLNERSPIRFQTIVSDEPLLTGHGYFVPDGRKTVVDYSAGQGTVSVRPILDAAEPRRQTDVLMQSAAIAYGARCMGVLLTGCGRDGVQGARAIGTLGGFVLGQDAESSYAYGTAGLAHQLGFVDRQFHLDDAADAISTMAPLLGQPAITIARAPILDYHAEMASAV